MIHRVLSGLPFGSLIPLKWMGFIPNGFGFRSSLPITLRFSSSVISEQLVGAFRVDWLRWSLGLGVNGNVGQVQIRKRGLDLTESVIKSVRKRATELR